MKNWFSLFALMVLVVMGSFVFVIAQRMHHAQTQLHRLQARITVEQENLRVLQAEWTYLNNPDRLEKLAVAEFGLVPMDGRQYAALTAVPTIETMDQVELAQAATEKPAAAVAEQAVPQAEFGGADAALALVNAPAPAAAMPAPINIGLVQTGTP